MALTLGTTILRTDADGDTVECDVAVHFTADCTSPGYPATRTDPGEGPEHECQFDGAELDGVPGKLTDAEPDKLTDAELGTLRTWFEANHDKAHEAANDNRAGWL
jgi:hypothetical protein